MITDLEIFIELINDKSGFTVVGWYKRGVFNDKCLIVSKTPIILTVVILPPTTILMKRISKLTQVK